MSVYKKYIGDLFVTLRFYLAMSACIVLYVLAFFYEPLYEFVNIVFAGLCLLIFADYFFLFIFSKAPAASRKVSEKLSNGEENEVSIFIVNKMPFTLHVKITDE